MSGKILFLTGKLAENSLNRVLESLQPKDFSYEVLPLGISVAALMTPELVMRRLPDARGAERILIPGLCRGELALLEQKYGVPVARGPEDLKDLPQFFGQGGKVPDLSRYDTQIFAEIVEATEFTVEQIVVSAKRYQAQGAGIIDLGCLPNTPFPHMEDAIQALHGEGFKVSVDSLDPQELLRAGHAGADYLLSLTSKTLWIAEEVSSVPVIIPAKQGSMRSLFGAIEQMQKWGKPFLADPILDPIPFGFTASLVRYHALKKRYPKIDIMMGVGNLTELTDADTTGINALLFGIIAELGIKAVLTTSVSPHAVNAIAEADVARRMMFAAAQDRRLPRGYTKGLLGLHDRRPFPYALDEINTIASAVKDPNFRIQNSSSGVHIYNRDGFYTDTDPFRLYPFLGVEEDASHAFYLGVELARAEIAWQLKKRYIQDEPLDWGCNTPVPDVRGRVDHRQAALEKKKK